MTGPKCEERDLFFGLVIVKHKMNPSAVVNFLESPAATLQSTNSRYDLFGQAVDNASGFTAGIVPTRPTDNNVTNGAYVPPYVHCVSYAGVPNSVAEGNSLSNLFASNDRSSGARGGYNDDLFYYAQEQAMTTNTPSNVLPPMTNDALPPPNALPGFSQMTNAPVPQSVTVLDSSRR